MAASKKGMKQQLQSSGAQQNSSAPELKAPPPTFLLPLNIAFYLCVASHILSAFYAPIQDCDETFNYWEPLHYLTHGYGFQTWEYSPEYSIRSWAYILLHAIPTKAVSLLGKSKTVEFYFIRVLLALVCAATETRLYSAICRNVNPRVGIFYLMVTAFTPGFFYASTALLPSSFAMYTTTLGFTAFMDWRGGSKTAQGIMWFGIGATLGWPFAGALIIPFVLEDWIVAATSGGVSVTFDRYLKGAIQCLTILCVQVAVDSAFYRKLVIVPWRIVSYNVFGGSDRGPDIFGTSPWHYYAQNLLLNFNIWFILGSIAGLLLLVQAVVVKKQLGKQTLTETSVCVAPFYLWLAIFTVQPHKEERFMFPAYPFLAFNAAVAMHLLLTWFGTSNPKTILGKIPPRVKLAVVLPIVLLAVNIGLLRILGTVVAYRAPLQVFEPLFSGINLTAADTVCMGKEWYRYPSSFFLPGNVHPKLIKSEFAGLMPGEFLERKEGTGLFPGTWITPAGMNDRNVEDPEKYTSLKECTFIVDSSMPCHHPTALEPDYIGSKEWERVACEPFLDAGSTGLLARIIWIPDLGLIPRNFKRSWGEYCLLRRSS